MSGLFKKKSTKAALALAASKSDGVTPKSALAGAPSAASSALAVAPAADSSTLERERDSLVTENATLKEDRTRLQEENDTLKGQVHLLKFKVSPEYHCSTCPC